MHDIRVPYCDHPDHGTCGNACCAIDIVVTGASSTDVWKAFTTELAKGGSDGSYTYVNNTVNGHNPSDNLKQYGSPHGYDYIFQGTHITTGKYVDTIDFNIKEVLTDAQVRIFSVAGIHG